MAEGLNGTKLEKIPISFQLGDNVVDGAMVRPLMFQAFYDIVNEALGLKQPAMWEARLRRVRMVKQVAYYINGTVMPVGMEDVLRLSIPDARKIIEQLDAHDGKPGKIIRDGDGISQAITYELGTPIQVGKQAITELEFQASTYGDIEDVMAANGEIRQTVLLIERAKPMHPTLQTLPSFATSQVTMADGVFIMNEVLPRFLESPE